MIVIVVIWVSRIIKTRMIIMIRMMIMRIALIMIVVGRRETISVLEEKGAG